MSPDFFNKWSLLIEEADKTKIPIQFIKKLVVKLGKKKQHTINVQTLYKQGLDDGEIEEIVNRKLEDLDDSITSVSFILHIEAIADTVEHETNKLLGRT